LILISFMDTLKDKMNEGNNNRSCRHSHMRNLLTKAGSYVFQIGVPFAGGFYGGLSATQGQDYYPAITSAAPIILSTLIGASGLGEPDYAGEKGAIRGGLIGAMSNFVGHIGGHAAGRVF
jgi:hypothetical protein